MTFRQVWPPADAATFVACRTEGDTRNGWVRWTWLAGEPLARVQGNVEDMLGDRTVISWTDPRETYAWACDQGWGYVSELYEPRTEPGE